MDLIQNHILKDFYLNYMNIVKKTCLEQQMTKKIAVEVDAKICFWEKVQKSAQIGKKKF